MQLFGSKGQKFLHCPGTKGQRDKLKILPRDRLSKSGTGCGTGRYKVLTACPVPSRGTKRDRADKDVLKQEKYVLKQEIGKKIVHLVYKIESDCVPGRPGTGQPVKNPVPSRPVARF